MVFQMFQTGWEPLKIVGIASMLFISRKKSRKDAIWIANTGSHESEWFIWCKGAFEHNTRLWIMGLCMEFCGKIYGKSESNFSIIIKLKRGTSIHFSLPNIYLLGSQEINRRDSYDTPYYTRIYFVLFNETLQSNYNFCMCRERQQRLRWDTSLFLGPLVRRIASLIFRFRDIRQIVIMLIYVCECCHYGSQHIHSGDTDPMKKRRRK